jgi:hypothetical protein
MKYETPVLAQTGEALELVQSILGDPDGDNAVSPEGHFSMLAVGLDE